MTFGTSYREGAARARCERVLYLSRPIAYRLFSFEFDVRALDPELTGLLR
jgi:hypothetical protein